MSHWDPVRSLNCFRNDPRYKDGPSDAEFPTCESLKLTIERTLPYWNEVSVDLDLDLSLTISPRR